MTPAKAYDPAQTYAEDDSRVAHLAETHQLTQDQARILHVRLLTAGQGLSQAEIALRSRVHSSTVWRALHDPRWLEALRQECQGRWAGAMPELAEQYVAKAQEGNIDALRDVSRTVGLIAPEQVVHRHVVEDARVSELLSGLQGLIGQLAAGGDPLLLPAEQVTSEGEGEGEGEGDQPAG